LQVEAQ